MTILLNNENEKRGQQRNFEVSVEVRCHEFAVNILVHTKNVYHCW